MLTLEEKGLMASDLPSGIDAAKIGNGSVSNTEFQYLDGVTSGIQSQINGIALQGTTVNSSGPVTVTTALSRQMFVATDAVHYDLPTGDLSAYIGAAVPPLRYSFCKSAAGTLTIDAGTGNYIASSTAGGTIKDSQAAETWATITLQLVSSATSVNKWVIVGMSGTWSTT